MPKCSPEKRKCWAIVIVIINDLKRRFIYYIYYLAYIILWKFAVEDFMWNTIFRLI